MRDLWRRCSRAAPSSGVGQPSPDQAVLQKSSAAETAGAASRESFRRAATAAPTADSYSGLPFEPDYDTGGPEGPGAHLAIVPGTRWCGNGNIATDYDDLGMW